MRTAIELAAPFRGITVYLPASARAAGPGSQAAPRSATVLVVDDDDAVREITGEMLASRGYAAVLAESGRRALEILRAPGREIDLVVLDWVMPERGGREVLPELHGLRPEMPVLISSGCDAARIARELGAARPAGFLRKPFDSDQLAAAVQEVLERFSLRGSIGLHAPGSSRPGRSR